MKKIAIVTGVSRGLGKNIASLFLESGVGVIGISRNKSHDLPEVAEENKQPFVHYNCDLSDPNQVEAVFHDLKKEVFADDVSQIFLVNNAASVGPIDQSVNLKTKELVEHININTLAPMILTNLLLKEAFAHKVAAISVVVSSGAAKRPISGWSAYCSSKASINMYTQTVALEQDELQTGNKIIAFDPGVMDTEMQETIRSSSKDAFSNVERYQNLKEEGQLNQPSDVAGVLIDIINDEDMVSGKLYNVKNYL